jgi:hypothetical protein
VNRKTDDKPHVPNLPSRNQVILDWCKIHRPDTVAHMQSILDKEDPALDFLIAMVFHAGRDFATDNPEVSRHQGV